MKTTSNDICNTLKVAVIQIGETTLTPWGKVKPKPRHIHPVNGKMATEASK